MRKAWEWIFRISGLGLSVAVVAFMTIPSIYGFKKILGLSCALFGFTCLVSMYFVKKPVSVEDIHVVNKELEHYDINDDANQ